jgi:hypothetical protein
MRAARLQDALERLTAAIRDVESELAAMKVERTLSFRAALIETSAIQKAESGAS